jgi:hypothetical protein
MKHIKKSIITINIVAVALLIITFEDSLWLNIEKIGALATALALFFAIWQGSIAQRSAISVEKSNQENIFQQLFNLILEQHNTEMRIVKNWLDDQAAAKEKCTQEYTILQDHNIPMIVKSIRGHNKLSPYMRLLHHTLKTIKSKHGSEEISKTQFFECKRYSSLVRSFIPNEILFLISLNSLVINSAYGEDTDYCQYKEYYDNLFFFDFFEHLVIKNGDIAFNTFTQQMQLAVIKEVLGEINNTIFSPPSTCNENKETLYINHISFINQKFSEPSFCIAAYYNHPLKYFSSIDNYNIKGSFKENINSTIDCYTSPKSKEKSIELIKDTFNEKIHDSIIHIFKNQSFCNHPPVGIVYQYKFLDIEDLDFLNFVLNTMQLDQDLSKLVAFKDNLTNIVLEWLEIKSCKFRDDTPSIYTNHFLKTHEIFCKTFGAKTDEIIRTKEYLSNNEKIYSEYIKKTLEMKERFNQYLFNAA